MRNVVLGVAAALAATSCLTAHAAGALTFGPAIQLPGADGGTEPRVSVEDSGAIDVISNKGGPAAVWRSTDGGASYAQTAAEPANQQVGSIDVDIVTLHSGRMVATELDFGGINFRTSYSDDGGRTWTASSFPGGAPAPFTGTGFADQDRPWLAAGPPDSSGTQPVYLLWHNLASGAVTHNMWVTKSADGGATFGAPVPITQPGQQAWNDLQCADSGGPSNIFVNQTTGRIYAVFGTRSTAAPAQAAGGCGASATGAFEINVVAATRVWVATSPDGSPGSWTQSLAVDDNATGQIVGMQLAPGAVDTAGNVYVLYPESVNPYPDYSGAAIKLVHAPADLSRWSAPVTVAPAGGAGHLLPHIVAGDPGHVGVAYFTGVDRAGRTPAWYADAAESSDALDATPAFTYTRLSDIVTYTGTASAMMGACQTQPPASAANGFNCNRSTDVWGIAVSPATGLFTVTWPVSGDTTFNDADAAKAGTYVATQSGGDPILTVSQPVVAEIPAVPLLLLSGAAILAGDRLRRRRTLCR